MANTSIEMEVRPALMGVALIHVARFSHDWLLMPIDVDALASALGRHLRYRVNGRGPWRRFRSWADE